MSRLLELAKAHVIGEDSRDVQATLDTMSEDCFYTMEAFGLDFRGKDQIGAHYSGTFSAIPDFYNSKLQWFDAGTDIFLRAEFEGTHNSEWNGIPATGNKFRMWATAHFPQGPDGRLAGENVYLNGNEMLYQMGALPSSNALEIYEHIRSLKARIAELETKLAKVGVAA